MERKILLMVYQRYFKRIVKLKYTPFTVDFYLQLLTRGPGFIIFQGDSQGSVSVFIYNEF